jgi:hypothetical protein
MLAENSCTKKLCSKVEERRAVTARLVSTLPSLPLLSNYATGAVDANNNGVSNDGGVDNVHLAGRDEAQEGADEEDVEEDGGAGGEWLEQLAEDGEGTGEYYYTVNFVDCVAGSFAAILEKDPNDQQCLAIKKVVRVCDTDGGEEKTFMARTLQCAKDSDTRACVQGSWHLPAGSKEELCTHSSIICLFKTLTRGNKLRAAVT